MKVLGYVNRYNRGIFNVQEELIENGNGKAIFDFDKITVFGAKVNNAVELLLKDLNVERKDFFVNYKENESVVHLSDKEIVSNNKDLDKDLDKLTKNQIKIMSKMKQNNFIPQSELSTIISINEKNIRNNIDKLKKLGKIRRVGGDFGGYWEVIS